MRDVRALERVRLRVYHELARRRWKEPRLATELGMQTRTLNERLNKKSDWKLTELLSLATLFYGGDLNRLIEPLDAHDLDEIPTSPASPPPHERHRHRALKLHKP